MQPDLRNALRAIAPTPRRRLDLGALRTRSKQLRRTRRIVSAVSIAVLVAAAPAVAVQVRSALEGSGPSRIAGVSGENCAPYGHETGVLVYVSDDATPRELTDYQEELASVDGVKAVYFISSEEALREFIDIYRGEPHLWETLGPRSLPASFRIMVHDPEDAQDVAASIPEPKFVDDVRWNREGEVEEWLAKNPEARLPTICLRIASPGDEPANRDEFDSHFITEPVTFSGSVDGTPWSLAARTAKSNGGEIGFCTDWTYGDDGGSGMDCVFTSGSPLEGDGPQRIGVTLDPTERKDGAPLGFYGLAPVETVEVQAEAQDGTIGDVTVYEIKDELGIQATLIVGFVDARDVTLRAVDENGDVVAEEQFDLGF